MALRVLLADESPTIKKAIQLALQDFAVEVRSVNIGTDVLNVALEFKPDIIFSDVLLQKRNGYEASSDIKSNPQTTHIPVVLMWSGFLSLDESKFMASRAEAKIEKPFDVDSLRQLVQNLVPKTTEQTLSSYLKFPNLPDIEEDERKKILRLQAEGAQQTTSNKPIAPPPPVRPAETPTQPQAITHQNETKWNMNDFQPITSVDHEPEEDIQFEEKQLTSADSTPFWDKDADDDSPWVQTDISQIEAPGSDFSETAAQSFVAPEPTSKVSFENEELQVEDLSPAPAVAEASVSDSFVGFERRGPKSPSRESIEAYISETIETQLTEMIKELVPKIAKQVIQQEIRKITQQEDEHEFS